MNIQEGSQGCATTSSDALAPLSVSTLVKRMCHTNVVDQLVSAGSRPGQHQIHRHNQDHHPRHDEACLLALNLGRVRNSHKIWKQVGANCQ